MSTPRPAGSLGDELTNLGIGLLVAAAALAAILRRAGSVAAWISGADQPAGGVEAGLGFSSTRSTRRCRSTRRD